jgi:hypothetical protein
MLTILSDPVDGDHHSSSSRYSCSACPWPSTCDILCPVLLSRACGLSTPQNRPYLDDIGDTEVRQRHGLRDLVISVPHSRHLTVERSLMGKAASVSLSSDLRSATTFLCAR